MNIRKIDLTNKRDVDKFIRFPFDLYKDSKLWVPPLISSVRSQLNHEVHPFFKHSVGDFFIAEDDRGKTIGRIAALENKRYNTHNNTNLGFFAFYEVVEDQEVSNQLFETVFEWCRQRGLTGVIGPKGLIGSDASGVLVEGFEHRPALNVPYNYPYYDEFITAVGFVKERDALSGYIHVPSWKFPDRVLRIAERIKKRRGYHVKHFKNKEEVLAIVPEFIEVHKRSFGGGHGYYPLTDDEYQWIANDLMSIVDPSLLKLVRKDDKIIGFLISYHDVSAGLQRAKGRLFPFGWLHILWDKRTTKWANVNGLGVLPEYQGTGANTIMYYELFNSVNPTQFEHVDTVIVGEENLESRGDNQAMGVTWRKRHRVYERDL